MKHVDIYTDGACSGNPGAGGWGAVIIYKGIEKELSGGEAQTTNNRMELTAVISALRALKEPCSVTLTSDSKYVVDGITLGWAKSWRAQPRPVAGAPRPFGRSQGGVRVGQGSRGSPL